LKPAKEIPSRITVHVPLKFVTRGGRKTIFMPASDAPSPPPANHNKALIKALARAHCWRKLIEDGEYSSITELAHAKGVNQSYACRLLRLTLISPDIVKTILDGKQFSELQLHDLLRPFPLHWPGQLDCFRHMT
jgi:hypothetical protein